MLKKSAGIALKILVTVALFVLLFRPQTFGFRADLCGGVTPARMLDELRGANLGTLIPWLLFGAVVKLAGMMAGVWRWQLLLQGQGLSIPFKYLVQSWFVGRLMGIVLPGTIGLDGYRFLDSARYTGEVIKSATVIAVEKLIGFIALTFLVFLTFPLGFRLLRINLPILIAVLVVLGAFVVVSFLLLLNPRVVQVLVAIVPAPEKLRAKFDKLGAAIMAYAGQRALLLKAVFLGLLVHLGTCFLLFGTMMAIRAQNTSLLDILFASPLIIYATVLGPSVGGEGIREIVCVYLLSGTTGATPAALFSHLAWWVGDVIPALIGTPIFLMRSTRARHAPTQRAQVEEEMAALRQKAATAKTISHLSAEAVSVYRRGILDCLLAGAGAGLIAGALVGLAEAGWIARTMAHAEELGVFWWAPLVYGALFVGVGVGAACAAAFLYLLFDRFATPARTLAFCIGASLFLGTLLLGEYHVKRDLLDDHALTWAQHLMVLGAAAVAGLLVERLLALGLPHLHTTRPKAAFATILVFALLVVGGGALAGAAALPAALPAAPSATDAPPAAPAGNSGPNVIFVAADALRADYLPLYNTQAIACTPNIAAFAGESVVFQNCFSQASWTKASFATIFSGRYPSSHTATSKTSLLPDEVVTFPELLLAAGYHTQGFANNPNITAEFNFQKGFSEYVDLKPDLYFGATPSATRLGLYQVLRRARQKISGKMRVTDYYQPADSVTQKALQWLDGREAEPGKPFFLFLHYMDTHDPYMDHHKPGVGYARSIMPDPNPEKYLDAMKGAYVSDIEYLDEHLGLLFQGLRQRGLHDHTVIVFTADHGEEFFDHNGWWHGQTLYEEMIRVPLIVKLPGQALAGQVNGELARHVDMAPTLLQFAKIAPDAAMQGKPLWGPDLSFANADTTFAYAEEDFEGNVLQAVRSRDVKLIEANPENKRRLAPVELYDVANDPREKANAAGKGDPREETLRNVAREMKAFVLKNAAEPVLKQEISADLQEQLNNAGYGRGK